MDLSRNEEGSHKSGQPEDNPEIMTNQVDDTSVRFLQNLCQLNKDLKTFAKTFKKLNRYN